MSERASAVQVDPAPALPGTPGAAQQVVWDAVTTGWARWAPEYEQAAAAVTDALVTLAGIVPGHQVLDVGSGLGTTARAAARACSPLGRVLGIDVSPRMVAAAAAAGPDEGNVEFVQADVDAVVLPEGAFDAVVSRWGLMFSPDRVVTLRRLRAAMRPGATLAAAVWGPPAQAPMVSLGFRVISEELALDPPPPGGPGPFSMADRDVVAAELARAGFTEISVGAHVVPFRLGSVADFVLFTHDVLPPGIRALLREHRGSESDPAVWRAVEAAAADFVVDGSEHVGVADGAEVGEVQLPSTCLLLRAVRPYHD